MHTQVPRSYIHGKNDPKALIEEITEQQTELNSTRSVLNQYVRQKVFINSSSAFERPQKLRIGAIQSFSRTS
jgi:hypothetical protein